MAVDLSDLVEGLQVEAYDVHKAAQAVIWPSDCLNV